MHTFVLTNMSMVMVALVNIAFKDPGQVWTTRPALTRAASIVDCGEGCEPNWSMNSEHRSDFENYSHRPSYKLKSVAAN